MSLQEQIDTARADIRTDGYSMSIGEWLSLYESDEIHIYPEFQRFYRWSTYQKSRLIESILLGIPIPPIFVSQRTDGVWDVVDGLQRLSTIYELAGLLKNEDGEPLPPLVLEGTTYLPDLKGKTWEGNNNAEPLTTTQRLLIKRSKIDVSIVLKESDEAAKYELFQRLNTGGTPLSDQEVRNSILVMLNPQMYEWMHSLSLQPAFRDTVALTDKAIEEQYDMELVLRFLVFRTLVQDQLQNVGDIGQFLSSQITDVAKTGRWNLEREEAAFSATFSILNETVGDRAFRRYDHSKQKFLGGFLVSAYETVALGLGFNYEAWGPEDVPNLEPKIKNIWRTDRFTENSGSGVRASTRLPRLIELGREVFQP